MKTISLTKGMVAKVDDEDFDRINSHKWRVGIREDGSFSYAVRSLPRVGGASQKREAMHRVIVGAKIGENVDHINHDRLDNRKKNLRICTASQNQMNRSGACRNSRTGVLGVIWRESHKKFNAVIRLNGKTRHLGYFDRIEDATACRIAASKKYYGEYAGSH